MIININPLNVAEQLAHEDVEKRFISKEFITEGYEEKRKTLFNLIDGIEVYHPQCQEYFQDRLDYYMEILTNSEIDVDHAAALSSHKEVLVMSETNYNLLKDACVVYETTEGDIFDINNSYFFVSKLQTNDTTNNNQSY